MLPPFNRVCNYNPIYLFASQWEKTLPRFFNYRLYYYYRNMSIFFRCFAAVLLLENIFLAAKGAVVGPTAWRFIGIAGISCEVSWDDWAPLE